MGLDNMSIKIKSSKKRRRKKEEERYPHDIHLSISRTTIVIIMIIWLVSWTFILPGHY